MIIISKKIILAKIPFLWFYCKKIQTLILELQNYKMTGFDFKKMVYHISKLGKTQF